MRQVELMAQKRNAFGKGAARSLRRAGIIPGVLYGRDQDTMSVQINEQTFKKFLRANGENMLIDLNIDEYGTETVLIKELQSLCLDVNLEKKESMEDRQALR